MKLKAKIIFIVIFIYLFVNIIFAFYYTSGIEKSSTEKLNKKTENIHHILKKVTPTPLYEKDISKLKRNLNFFLNTPEIVYIHLKETNGNINIDLGNKKIEKNAHISKVTNVIYENKKIGIITVYYSKKAIENEISNAFLQIAIFYLIATIFVSLALYFFMKKLLTPISQLRIQATKIANGDLEKDIPIKTDDEIGELAKQFDIMRNTLKERIQTIDSQNHKMRDFNKKLEVQVTQRTKELVEQTNMFETLVNAIPDLVWMKDEEGIFLHCNKRFTEFYGASREEIVGKTDYHFVEKKLADFFRMHDNKAMKANTPLMNYEIIPFASDGHEEYTQTIKTVVKDQEGTILGVLGVGRNFTKEQAQKEELEAAIRNLKITQNKLIEAEKMSSLGVLVSGIAHEINTPVGIGLTGITHFLELTKKINEDYEKQNMSQDEFETYISTAKEVALLINSNLQKTAQLIKNFKKISFDQSSEEIRKIELKAYIDEILFSINNITKKTKLKIENLCEENININTYPGAISQIITNLIINSIRHGFEKNQEGTITIFATQEEQIIRLVYKDSGKGIEKDILPKIFDPFFTTNREKGGTGLGLNIIYNIISNTLHGTIKCNSEKNNGVEFIILFQENEKNDKIEKETLWQI